MADKVLNLPENANVLAAGGAEPKRTQEAVTAARAYANLRVDRTEFTLGGEEHWRRMLEGTHLEEELQLRGNDALQQMAWAKAIADIAVDWLFDHILEPDVLAASVAQIVEASLHTFGHPISNKRVRNLSAAKRHGTFFTPDAVGRTMASAVLKALDPATAEGIHVLEPAAGTGALASSLLVEAFAQGVTVDRIVLLELSPSLANVADRTVRRVNELLGGSTSVETVVTDALQYLSESTPDFDAVIMNPPYGRLKFLKSFVTDSQTRASDVESATTREAERMALLRSRLARLVSHAGLGGAGADMQSLFTVSALNVLRPHGYLAVISPSAWTSSASYIGLRKLLIGEGRVKSITHYPESAQLFATVNQPTAVTVIGPPHESRIAISEAGDSTSFLIAPSELDPRTLKIPKLSPEEIAAYKLLSQAGTLSSYGVTSRRGEVDLTLDRELISSELTGHRLVRGDHLERFTLRAATASAKDGHLTAAGALVIAKRPKAQHVAAERIAGRQVSYMGKARRLSFATIPSGVYVANSCNYLVLPDGLDRHEVVGVLNSSALDWWFKVHSSNNHVSNAEIDDLPWPELSTKQKTLVSLASQAIAEGRACGHNTEHLEDIIDALVLLAFGLPPNAAQALLARELETIRLERVLNLVSWFGREGIPDGLLSATGLSQHAVPALSALDRQMISHVPQGGNWQQIPTTVPSKRLDQIRRMSAERGVVRTTYYGRLRPDQPAYTIATYYNRPGNGTNIHPTEDRTLSHREAARLQSFPDSFLFVGNEGAIRKQIGNAVPPKLGEALGGALLEAGLGGLVVDLFAGSGGLSLGLEGSGLDVAVAVDNDKACEATYTFNRPSELTADPNSSRTLFIRADLSSEAGREAALLATRQKLAGRRVNILVGGPPCQGFSHAGFRSESDDRNDLAVAFLKIAHELQPDAIVMENVEGILSYRKGEVVRDLIATLQELEYQIDVPWLLAAEQYGVPQMRRRVFLVASRNGIVAPPEPRYQKCLGRREVERVDGDLPYPVTVADALSGLQRLTHD
ncbi:MAG: DNA (cytosine-5-)-methyltransferase [Microcella pacifica]